MPKTREQQRQYEAAYRQRHRAMINARNRERYKAKPHEPEPISDERKAYLREYREKNREQLAAKRREYVEANGDTIKAQQAEYRKLKAKERSARQQAYYRKNRAARAVYNRHYAIKAKDRLRKKRQERYANDPGYRLRLNLRNRLNAAVRNGCRAGSAVRDLGCTVEAFVAYIANLFLPGMSWENWGKWHLDHIKPLASFDLTDREQFLAACHYTNMRPLWSGDNLRKGVRIV